jgi:polyisoprenyl-phosphate glycosyltransferase
VILVVLGVQGQYIARIYEEVKDRPLYLIQDLRGFERPTAIAAAPAIGVQRRRAAAGRNGSLREPAVLTREHA